MVVKPLTNSMMQYIMRHHQYARHFFKNNTIYKQKKIEPQFKNQFPRRKYLLTCQSVSQVNTNTYNISANIDEPQFNIDDNNQYSVLLFQQWRQRMGCVTVRILHTCEGTFLGLFCCQKKDRKSIVVKNAPFLKCGVQWDIC